MQDKLIREIKHGMSGELSGEQARKLTEVLYECLKGYEITTKIAEEETGGNEYPLDMFIEAKRVEGCSEITLKYYKRAIQAMLEQVNKRVRDVSTDDLRMYLGKYQSERGVSRVTVDNSRRVLSSFFGWLEDEDFIVKSPVRRIHKIKTGKIVKEAFSDENIESMRNACVEERDRALLELLISTGMRVGELVKLNRADVDLTERSCVVQGKGNAEREVYFDARAKIHLEQYLSQRKDEHPALFVSRRLPYGRLGPGGVELLLHKIGEEAGVGDVYPHKFRRTMATMAIDKGMPIEQVQKLLGHVRIDTTMHYAMVNQTNVKQAHRRYIG